jgi:hypothetical protein
MIVGLLMLDLEMVIHLDGLVDKEAKGQWNGFGGWLTAKDDRVVILAGTLFEQAEGGRVDMKLEGRELEGEGGIEWC